MPDLVKVTITGDQELDYALRQAGTKISDKAIASGIRAALGEIRKSIRGSIANPRVRKTIASRFKRKAKYGIVQAKVGAGVGSHKAAAEGRTRPGVGISKQNAHWYFLGTKKRANYTRGNANRGSMPPHHAVAIGWAKGRSQAMTKLITKTRETLRKEVAKLPKGKR